MFCRSEATGASCTGLYRIIILVCKRHETTEIGESTEKEILRLSVLCASAVRFFCLRLRRPRKIEELKNSLRGEILLPSDDAYESARKI